MTGVATTRLAACESCRQLKAACDHRQPACTRCSSRGQSAHCIYRSRPFRRRAAPRRSENAQAEVPSRTALETPIAPSSATTQQRQYPEPGFLGASSHSTLFNQVSSVAQTDIDASRFSPVPMTDVMDYPIVADRVTNALEQIAQIAVPDVALLMRSWLSKGVNLPLAGPFVFACLEAVEKWWPSATPGASGDMEGAMSQDGRTVDRKTILLNTQKPLTLYGTMSTKDLITQMVGDNLRWESLGIFFTAASRAAYDIPLFAPLYRNNETRRRLIRALTYVGDYCLEICLSLDCLNDLQLILQYENFIVHSQVDGDQSYHSWRRIGDVASSCFALGYHETVDQGGNDLPAFALELRKACFARIYTADKSLAIFLGRPPRIVKDYCHFTIPCSTQYQGSGESYAEASETSGSSRDATTGCTIHSESIDYTADTRCSALFALLKEEMLQLLRKKQANSEIGDLCGLRARIVQQWDSLPLHYRLQTKLHQCQQGPFERDFLAGTRLDYLHVHFLLESVCQLRMGEPTEGLLTVALEMLSLTVEVIILRDQLINSGSCLIWKVAQYGLPAAGAISLALLNLPHSPAVTCSRSIMIQNLSVLVAEVTYGAWIQPGEPNFALFTRATRTIKSLLDCILVPSPHEPLVPQSMAPGWDLFGNSSQLWEFETDFWANLAEHPTLMV